MTVDYYSGLITIFVTDFAYVKTNSVNLTLYDGERESYYYFDVIITNSPPYFVFPENYSTDISLNLLTTFCKELPPSYDDENNTITISYSGKHAFITFN